MQTSGKPEPNKKTKQTEGQSDYQTDLDESNSCSNDTTVEANNKQVLIGRLVYLALVFAFLGLFVVWPAIHLWQQEQAQTQVAGMQEQEVGVDDKIDQGSNTNSVYVYDPKQQNFVKKDATKPINSDNTELNYTSTNTNSGAVNLNPTNPMAGVTFAEAFALAREQLGPNAVFEWNGQLYTTNLASEIKQPTSVVKNLFADLNPKRKFQKDSTSRVLEINECNLNVKYPIKTANGALVDFDRFDPPAPARPFWNFYAFTGYRTPTEKFGEGYTVFVQCFYVSQMSQPFQASLTGKNAISPEELFKLTGWFIADESIQNLQVSQNKDLKNGYSVVFTRKGILYSISFMAAPKDDNDKIGGLYASQIQLQFQDWLS